LNADLLKKLLSTPGISGREERIRDVVKDELADLVDEVRVDRLGNVIGFRKGNGPRVMLCAHMDSIGFLVRHVDDEGFLWVAPVGGFDARVLVMQRVLVYGENDYIGVMSSMQKPIHLLDEEEKKKSPKIEDIFVDLLLPPEQVKASVQVGDPICYYREPEVTESVVLAPYLDDRAGVYMMIEALRAARKTKAPICAVASVQEEVGVRGAITSAFGVEPDIGVALDITLAADIPGTEKSDRVTTLGGGVGLGVMDKMSISDPRLVRHFQDIASKAGLDVQLDILLAGGTDAAAIQMSRAGVPVITIGPPVRYVHTVNEAAAVSDLDASVELTARFLEGAHDLELNW
jgi:putative aminopeptidase FrvX